MLILILASSLRWALSQSNMSTWGRWDGNGWVGGTDGLKPVPIAEVKAASPIDATDRYIMMDRSLCLEASRPLVRGVKLHTGPMPVSGLQFLLLRAVEDELMIVDATVLNQPHTFPDDSELLFNLPVDSGLPLYGQAGDCLGWVLPANNTDGIMPKASPAKSTVYQSWSLSIAVQLVPGTRVKFGGEFFELANGARVRMGNLPTKHNFAIAWYTTGTPQALWQFPQPWRARHLRSMIDALGDSPGISSAAYKRDILKFFGRSHWAERAVVEIGTAGGGTTLLLSAVFSRVYTLDIHVDFQHTMLNDPRKLGPVPNVIPLHVNANLPYAFSMLQADPGIKVAVIDGDHAYASVVKNIFSVLHDIPSCCDVLVFHDFCDDAVYAAVYEFVSTDILTIRQGVGDQPGSYSWCKDGRAEGAVFDVSKIATKAYLERTYWRIMFRLEPPSVAEVRKKLEGTSWLAMQQNYPIGVLVLGRNFQLDFQQLPVHAFDSFTVTKHVIGVLHNLRWASNTETGNNVFNMVCDAELRSSEHDSSQIIGNVVFSDPNWKSFDLELHEAVPVMGSTKRFYAVHYTLLKDLVHHHMSPLADVRVR